VRLGRALKENTKEVAVRVRPSSWVTGKKNTERPYACNPPPSTRMAQLTAIMRQPM